LTPSWSKASSPACPPWTRRAWQDPLVAIREITEEKLAHGERQLGKRFAAEAAKLKEKSAMSVPGAGAGSGAKAPVDAQLAEVDRIRNMSDAEFQKEVRRGQGLLDPIGIMAPPPPFPKSHRASKPSTTATC
jgi:hypothetical protein